MTKKKVKLVVFITLLLSMIFYIGWVFYVSEPKYIDSCYKIPERYDYVSIPEYKYRYTYSWQTNTEVINGIILQCDSTMALVKVKNGNEEFYQLDLKKSDYRIIGKGTVYHKINDYVGFNIMMITQIFIMILAIVIGITVFSTLTDLLKD